MHACYAHEMRQTSFADFHCSLAKSLEAIGDWWSPLIVRDLFIGIRRFDELVEDLGISRNLLTDRLTTLAEHGVIQSERYSEHARRVEYSLTESGRELAVILMALTTWGDRWQTPVNGPPIRFRHHKHRCEPKIVCSTCNEPIAAEDITFRPGPGGQAGPGTQLIGTLIVSAPSTTGGV
jgi:DNA-binding HxlR family transcriptional regulator